MRLITETIIVQTAEGQRTATYEAHVDMPALRQKAARALRNKGGIAKVGPLTIRILKEAQK